jgi:glycine/D-amino acid oxidase-like deaminating enzyme
MRDSNDVIIIGGGINGVCTAFHLAKRGASVTLLEKSFIAGGPTGVSSAIVRQHYSNPVTIRMALESLRVWQNFGDVTGERPVFTETGFLLGVRPEDIVALKANLALQQSAGIDTRYVSLEEMRDLEPNLDTSGLGGGAYEPESGYCDPAEAANGFSQAARRLGAKIRTGTTTTGFIIENGKVMGVHTNQGDVLGGKVVIAAGPWSNQLLQSLGLEIPMTVARIKVGIYQRPADFDRHQIWADFITQVYLRPETGGHMLVGSIAPEEETGDQVHDPDNFNERVELDTLANFIERVATRYPAMERSHLSSSYASLYDVTPDWHHIMDAVPGVEGLYLCAGSSGHGFKLGPAVGRMMSKLILDGKEPGEDIQLFAWDRFERGNPVRSQYEYSILA